MKGYKATLNMQCLGFTYEVGKTYEMENIEICKRGFHYCKDPRDVLKYYNYDTNFILLEVEDLGNTITEGNKSVTNKLRIVRIISKEEMESLLDIKVDDEGRIIYRKDSYGYEEWKEYDSNGNMIHYKDSEGYEEWCH